MKASKHKAKKSRESDDNGVKKQTTDELQSNLNSRKLPPVPKVDIDYLSDDLRKGKQKAHEKPEMTTTGSLLRCVDVKEMLCLNDQQLVSIKFIDLYAVIHLYPYLHIIK